MSERRLILAINPGSGSTKVGLFETSGGGEVRERLNLTVEHDEGELRGAASIQDQLAFRRDAVAAALDREEVPLDELAAVVGRGGLLPPLPGGTYGVNEAMIEELRRA